MARVERRWMNPSEKRIIFHISFDIFHLPVALPVRNIGYPLVRTDIGNLRIYGISRSHKWPSEKCQMRSDNMIRSFPRVNPPLTLSSV